MAHTCPECGSYCTCMGDWDDIDTGEWHRCICCIGSDVDDPDDNDEIEWDNPHRKEYKDNDPNDSRNL